MKQYMPSPPTMYSWHTHLGVVAPQDVRHGRVKRVGVGGLVPGPVLLEVRCRAPADHGRHALRYLVRAPRPLRRHRLRAQQSPLRIQEGHIRRCRPGAVLYLPTLKITADLSS